LTTDFIFFLDQKPLYKNPLEIPEGTHGKLDFWIGPRIDVMIEELEILTE